MKTCFWALALIALTRASVTLPSTWSWTSSSMLVDVKTDSSHSTVHSIKDPTIAYYNGVYHVYATIHTSSTYSMVYLNFTSFDKASSAKWYYMDQTSGFGGYKCAPELFYMSTQKLWYLTFQSPYPTYSTNTNPGNPAGWSSPKYFFTTMPTNAIDFFPICDDSTCYLFFSNDAGSWYRTSTPKSSFPSGWSTTFTTVLKSSGSYTYFEASWVFRLTTQKLYIAGIEGIGSSGKRYYQAFTATSLDGTWTEFAPNFATKDNVKFTGTAWSSGVSHGELLRASYDETWQVNPCDIKFFYQGLSASASASYDQLPYKLGLLNSTTTITGCSTASTSCSLTLSSITGASALGTCSSSVSSGSSCALTCSSGYTAVSGTCSSGTWSPSPSCSQVCTVSSLPTGASSTGTCSSVSAGSSCSLSCSSGYTAVSGVCSSSGVWSTSPSCKANSCTLSSTLPTGASDMGTCGTTVSSGSSCKYTCLSTYTAVTGKCQAGYWTVSPSCTASSTSSSCTLSSLPTGASGWGTCSTSVTAGSSCKLSCDTSAVTGYCSSSGTWTTQPSCTSSCTAKSCGTQTCGSFWNGCATVSCGSCQSGYSCDGTTCQEDDSSLDWSQVYPDSFTSLNWAVSNNVLTLTNTSLPKVQRIIGYTGSSSGWFGSSKTVATLLCKATEGIVGVGMRLGQGTGRTTDRIGWGAVLGDDDNSKASTYYCSTYNGDESCSSGASSVKWYPSGYNNFTVSLTVGNSVIASEAWVNNVSLVSTAFTGTLSNFKTTGKFFISTEGSETKSFTNLVIRSQTTVHVALYQCMSESAWRSFVSNLLGISPSRVSMHGTSSILCSSNRRGCSSKKKRAAVAGENLFTEFVMTLPDSEDGATSSSAMLDILQSAINDGAATWAGFDVQSIEMVLPTATGILVGGDVAVAAAAGLSTGAIAAIAAGGGGGLLLAGAAATTVAVVVKRRRSSKERETSAEVPMGEKKPSIVRSGLNVMDMSEGVVHSSITARAAPVAI